MTECAPEYEIKCANWSCSCFFPPAVTDYWESAENGPDGCVAMTSHLAIVRSLTQWNHIPRLPVIMNWIRVESEEGASIGAADFRRPPA